eukprot:1887473-Rhodomonas_salina.2
MILQHWQPDRNDRWPIQSSSADSHPYRLGGSGCRKEFRHKDRDSAASSDRHTVQMVPGCRIMSVSTCVSRLKTLIFEATSNLESVGALAA